MLMCLICDFMHCYGFLEWSQVREWYTHVYRQFDTYLAEIHKKEKVHIVG
jgi:predicted N-acyltransferase